MLIIGDSHVRRLSEVGYLLDYHLRGVRVDWWHKGGAGISYAEECLPYIRGYKVIIVMLGGNDIDNGMSPAQLQQRVAWITNEMLKRGPDCVIVPSIWPRQNFFFNNTIRYYADVMERQYFGDPSVTFWRWDNRQSWKTYDGVHLPLAGYERAIRTIVSMIVWAINHNQW